VTPLFGIYQRVDFQDTKTVGVSTAYHFSEMWGAELMGYKMLASDSHVLSRFKDATGSTIDFNQERYYLGASALFTPIYGKFSLFGNKISHFDIYLAPGAGITKTNAAHFTPSMGVGQKFWITPRWNFRVEYRWMRYDDTINASTGTAAIKNGGTGSFSDTITNQNLMFGISYLFN
ncbi:MAG: outer membrane beta-barrel domain-containing protein, partial [Deltaproteobacteria bacterium]|nr:outer membrane beta-barrel domain-containing protein [Deltaproteobacteria bacterium]